MAASDIVVKGAREHNLRDVDLSLPRNRLICLTGVSGSGKSSLAFDTLYAEGQRRYIESLSTFARQFLGQMPKPDVDHISGLSPTISISQKSSGQNPRSTVGTITEIYDYLRVLYARVGQGYCPKCGCPITAQSREQILDRIATLPAGTKFSVLAPLIRRQKGEYRDLFVDLLKQGFVRARVDGQVVALSDDLRLDRQMRHNVEVVIDRLAAGPDLRARLAEAVDLALKVGGGSLIVAPETAAARQPRNHETPIQDDVDEESSSQSTQSSQTGDIIFSAQYSCTPCGLSFEPPSPQLFSFNSPQGMCPGCDGLGESYSFDPAKLIPNEAVSFEEGCFVPIGPWKDLGRWRRHIYQGVADTLEYHHSLPQGTILGSRWSDLSLELKDLLLYGTGDLHITFTWRQGANGMKYGGRFEGIIPGLLSKYKGSKSATHRRELEKYMSVVHCGKCGGERLNQQARAVRIASGNDRFAGRGKMSLPEVSRLSITEAALFFSELELDDTGRLIAAEALKEIRGRLGFLINVGLDYLTLDRTAPTLSGGESQRIRLAGQIGCGLVGVLYILDEPSIGLHPRDNERLLSTLVRLRDQGNTVLVVEHDEDTMRSADLIVDFGPGPGIRGGEVVAVGSAAEIIRAPRSVTGQFLAGREKIEVPPARRPIGDKRLTIVGAAHNNLKGVDIEVPLGAFVCVTGVSGSGKSSLVNDILVEALHRDLNRGDGNPGRHERIDGLEHLDKLIAIDQSPIGRTPRSNPGTYIKVFDDIRRLYAQLPESKARGYKEGRFSFNVTGGRCEACQGNGANRLEMDFLADIWVACPVCGGHRFNRETLQVQFKGKSIADVLEMDVQQALSHFENIPAVRHKLQTLHDVGLDYIKLGQPSPTLSGGEAQRIKLARELVKSSTGKTLYLLDEPTTGLHFADIRMLLKVLHGFVEAGNTVLVVEHNLDVVKTADWIIDLGPEGGDAGGRIIATGTPEQVAAVDDSHTGRSLAAVLDGGASSNGRKAKSGRKHTPPPAPHTTSIKIRGAKQHNLKSIDVEIPRDQMTVCCGPSGSGKSSLAMDTIYAEGQRRYVESLSSYARQFVGQMQKPHVEHIEGLSPAIAIEQKNLGNTPRSTVGTVTEIYDYLRVLYARIGTPHCPRCDVAIGTQTSDQIVEKIISLEPGTRLYLLAPLQIDVGERYEALWEDLKSKGYVRVRIDGKTHSLDETPSIDRRRKHAVEVLVDRISVKRESRTRFAQSVETALDLGRGVLNIAYVEEKRPEARWRTEAHSQHLSCAKCGTSYDPLSPHHFSFNSALGWCTSCEGLGTQRGANPAALLNDPKRTLAEGALALWPDLATDLGRAMLVALSAHANIPLDVPFEGLSTRDRRLIFHGMGDEWIAVPRPGEKNPEARPLLRFQFKGLYPALDEAGRLAPSIWAAIEHLVDEVECSSCGGSRLREDAGAFRFRDRTLAEIARRPLGELLAEIQGWDLSPTERKIAGELVREIEGRVRFLVDVGLDYLTLGRPAPTLSGGEAQRIRLASQVGSGLSGVLYVLDEPTIGLHPRDNRRLLKALEDLRDLGNTLILVEHDREVVQAADQLLDFGPGAGRHGGQIVASGTPKQVGRSKDSVTGPYLSGKKAIAIPANRRSTADCGWLQILGARHNNLRNIDVKIPLGALTAITGVSGSGKSSLVDDILYNALARLLHRARTIPGSHDTIKGVVEINKVIRVDQQSLGNTPTSNPATYTGLFELIRDLFAQLPDSKLRGYTARRFSFNVPGGRCERCEGNGQLRIEMHFLPDVWVECSECRGKRYNLETLVPQFHGHSIADVLELSCGQALDLFKNIAPIRRILQTLCDVGLDYLTLGQAAPTLSGGEAQRVKLAAELSRPDTGRTLYLLDEPTTGLHFEDLARLLEVLHRLVDLGNTVVVIEHNLDVVKTVDWMIDLGPEAGDGGGHLVACGTPEQVVSYAKSAAPKNGNGKRKSAANPRHRSHTGELLAPVLEAGPRIERPRYDPAKEAARMAAAVEIREVGREVNMPWESDGRNWHTKQRVGRNGQPCRWDGRILREIVDRVHSLGQFSQTDWNSRTIVEISAETKSDGWFFHAVTGNEWLLDLKFRVAKGTFRRDQLVGDLGLKPLNEMPHLPVYGTDPRVKCKTLRGPWQEIQLRVHSWEEVDRPQFWSFLELAVSGFQRFTDKARESPDAIMPWKVMGRKWHLSRKGFPPGKKPQWEPELLEELCELLTEAAPDAQFLWNNQQVVHAFIKGQTDAWATIHTKRLAALELALIGPKGRFGFGRIAELGAARELAGDRRDTDLIKLQFLSVDDLHRGELIGFLRDHAQSLAVEAAI